MSILRVILRKLYLSSKRNTGMERNTGMCDATRNRDELGQVFDEFTPILAKSPKIHPEVSMFVRLMPYTWRKQPWNCEPFHMEMAHPHTFKRGAIHMATKK